MHFARELHIQPHLQLALPFSCLAFCKGLEGLALCYVILQSERTIGRHFETGIELRARCRQACCSSIKQRASTCSPSAKRWKASEATREGQCAGSQRGPDASGSSLIGMPEGTMMPSAAAQATGLLHESSHLRTPGHHCSSAPHSGAQTAHGTCYSTGSESAQTKHVAGPAGAKFFCSNSAGPTKPAAPGLLQPVAWQGAAPQEPAGMQRPCYV